MSKIDGLLRLASMQSADELVLRAEQPPALRVAGVLRKLSMPVMDESLVLDVLREAIGEHAARADGEERCTINGHGVVRVRWRRADKLEASFARARSTATTTHGSGATSTPSAHASTRASQPIEERAVASPAGEPVAIAARLAHFLELALQAGASDLVLVEGRAVAMKVNGEMTRVADSPRSSLDEGEVVAMLSPHLDPAHRATFERTGSVDFALELSRDARCSRFRCSLFRAHAGASAVLRPIRERAPTLRELRLPDELSRLIERHDGLVIVTGAAGSGKSTTLVALVEELNRTRASHVVTLEDPIEHVFEEGRAVIHQREVGAHVGSFAEGLRAALRESPDVILLGEMRDPETIAAAVTAAETGHLVLSTLHAGSAGGAIERIVDAFPEHAQRQARGQLADVLRAVVTQRLLPSRDGGRVPALEILPVNAAVANLIREGKAYQIPQVLQTGRDSGMVPMARAIAELIKAGVVDRESALAHAPDPQHVIEQLRAR